MVDLAPCRGQGLDKQPPCAAPPHIWPQRGGFVQCGSCTTALGPHLSLLALRELDWLLSSLSPQCALPTLQCALVPPISCIPFSLPKLERYCS